MNGYFLTESLKWVFSLQLLKLDWGVLVQELINGEISSSDSDLDVVLLHLHSDSLGSELIHSFRLSHEHDLEFGSLWVVVNEFSQFLVHGILLHWDVNGDSLLQVNYVLLESLNLSLSILQLLQQLEGSFVSFINFLFKLKNVV